MTDIGEVESKTNKAWREIVKLLEILSYTFIRHSFALFLENIVPSADV